MDFSVILFCLYVKPYAIIADFNLITQIAHAGTNHNTSALLFNTNPMLYGIFDQRLHRKRGDLEICCFDLIGNLQFIPKTHLFQPYIRLNMVQLPTKWNRRKSLHAL